MNSVLAGLKYFLLCYRLVAYRIDGVVVNIDHILTADQFPAFSPLHIQDIGVLYGHTFGVGGTKNFLALYRGTDRHTVRQNFHIFIHAQPMGREQSSHAELGDRGENSLH